MTAVSWAGCHPGRACSGSPPRWCSLSRAVLFIPDDRVVLAEAADALAAGLATGIGRLGVRVGVEYQSAARSTGWRTARPPGGLSVRARRGFATRTPRTRTIQEDIQLVRIALI